MNPVRSADYAERCSWGPTRRYTMAMKRKAGKKKAGKKKGTKKKSAKRKSTRKPRRMGASVVRVPQEQ